MQAKPDPLNQTALQTLLAHLPRHAEEGSLSTSVPRDDLRLALCETGLSSEAATAWLALLERLLVALACLEQPALAHGEWRFVSFPAQLCATSVLHILADSERSVFEPFFWTLSPDSAQVREQHSALDWLEQRRLNACLTQTPVPIRQVRVAWGLVRLEGRFLLHLREGQLRREGEYVFIGGGCNLSDARHLKPQAQADELLALLEQTPKAMCQPLAETALQREVQLATGLVYPRDYHFEPWHDAPLDYQGISGATAVRAYTHFQIHVYVVHLKLTGLFRLLARVEGHSLKWFSAAEVAQGKSQDGRSAYLLALYQAFDNDRQALQRQLEQVSEAFVNRYRLSAEKHSLTLPVYAKTPLTQGITRHEEVVSLILSQDETRLLYALAAQAKGFAFVQWTKGVTALSYGWLKVTDAQQASTLQALAERCCAANLPLLEVDTGRFFRLSVAPECLFFANELFSYTLSFVAEEDKWRLTLFRREVDTPLGRVAAAEKSVLLSRNLARRLQQVQEQGLSCIDDEGTLKELAKKSLEQKLGLEQVGLRKFLRIEQNQYVLACCFRGVKNISPI